jgi:hypothetical protein
MQNGTTFYLLDFVDGLNFRGMVLSQSNLIRTEEKTFSSPDPHQNLYVKFNLP